MRKKTNQYGQTNKLVSVSDSFVSVRNREKSKEIVEMEVKLFNFLRSHYAGLILSIVIWLNIVGVSYNMGVFAAYGYSYADFADASDFLLSGLKNPSVIFISIFVCLYAFFIYFTLKSLIYIYDKKVRSLRISKYVLKIFSFDLLFPNVKELLAFAGFLSFFAAIIYVPFQSGVNSSVGNFKVFENFDSKPSILEPLYLFGDVFMGAYPFVSLSCELSKNGRREGVDYVGRFLAETSEVILLDSVKFRGIIIYKSCVKSIRGLNFDELQEIRDSLPKNIQRELTLHEIRRQID